MYLALVETLKVLVWVVRLAALFRSNSNSKPKASWWCTDHVKSHSWMIILFFRQDLRIVTAVVPGH